MTLRPSSSRVKHRWAGLVVVVIATMLLSTQVVLGSHPEVSLPGSDFEIDTDANLKVDDSSPSIDWGSVSETRKQDEGSGQQDDSFGNGSKEDTAIPSVVAGSIPPNKSDLLNFGVYLENTGTAKFLHLFWHRVQEPSGTTNMDFEFNQSTGTTSNGVTPPRMAGDLLVQYDLAQGGTTPVLFISRWVTSGPSSQCEASNSLPCWSDKVNLSVAGDATGSINTSAIPAAESEGLGNVSARTFGEATLDFDAIAGSGSGGCASFGSAYLKSRSSDSFTAALKDFIAPVATNVSNCGTIKITKQTNPDGASGSFGFTTTGGLSPSTFSKSDGQTQIFNNVLAGEYTVTEDDPGTGFALTDISCTVTGSDDTTTSKDVDTRTATISLAAGDTVECTFTNLELVYELNIVKDASVPGDTADVAGEKISYTMTVTNEGNTTLTGITVTDPNCDAAPVRTGGDTNGDNKLQTTETWTYSCERTVSQAEIDSNGAGDGFLENTATADSVESPSDSDDASVPISRDAEIKVVKSSTTTLITDAGQVVPYTFVVTNEGNVTLTGVTVTDPNCNAAPARTGGDTNGDNTLQTSETWTYTCSHTVTQAEIDDNGVGTDGDLDNTVTADSVESGPDTDDYSIPVDYDPAIKVVKSSTTTTVSAAGQVVPYTFVVTNEGNVTLTGITVTDPNCNAAPVRTGGDTDGDNKLDLTESWTYTCSHTVSQAEIDAGGNLDIDDDELNDVLHNLVTADSEESDADTDELDIPVVAQGAIDTEDSFVPQDVITLSGLTADAAGDLHVALRLDEDCDAAGDPEWEYTWEGVGNGNFYTKDVDPQPEAISVTHTVVWCSEYSGDAHNAPITLSNNGEIAHIQFDPTDAFGLGLGSGLTFLAWALWSRRRREDES